MAGVPSVTSSSCNCALKVQKLRWQTKKTGLVGHNLAKLSSPVHAFCFGEGKQDGDKNGQALHTGDTWDVHTGSASW